MASEFNNSKRSKRIAEDGVGRRFDYTKYAEKYELAF